MAVCNQLINLLTLVLIIGTLPITSVRSAAVLLAPASRTLANITVTKVVTATQATTTTQSAVLTCTTLAAPLAITSTAVPPCRRKKQLLRGVPVQAFYYTVAGEDIDQFHSLNPTHVFKVEPSAVLQVPEESLGDEGEVRAGVWVIAVAGRRHPAAFEAIESSLDDGIRSSAEAFRISSSSQQHLADHPRLFSALFSSLLSGWQFPTIVTVTRTVYTATSTATLFTSTSVHTLLSAASCLPADFVACPSWEIEEEEETPTPSTTDDPDILPSTDVL